MTDEEKQAQSKEYMRAWRAAKKAADPEYQSRLNARRRAKWATDPDYKTKCYSRNRAWLAERPGYHARFDRKRWGAMSDKERMWNSARGRAGMRGLPFSITVDDIVIPATCPVLGIPLEQQKGRGKGSNRSPSLDRIDNTKGYVLGNIQVISFRANKLKNDATLEELEALVAHLRRLRGAP